VTSYLGNDLPWPQLDSRTVVGHSLHLCVACHPAAASVSVQEQGWTGRSSASARLGNLPSFPPSALLRYAQTWGAQRGYLKDPAHIRELLPLPNALNSLCYVLRCISDKHHTHPEKLSGPNMHTADVPEVLCEDEWSSLQEVIVGRAEHSQFPGEPHDHIGAIMPPEHIDQFRPGNPFPAEIVREADKELNNLSAFLKHRGIKVHRPSLVDWRKVGGYTASMPRDALLVVGCTIIESCFAWRCRRNEVQLAYGSIIDQLEASGQYAVIRAPAIARENDVYITGTSPRNSRWQINESRPAFDAADFIRCGNFVIGQRSHVTNASGIAYLRQHLAQGQRRVALPEIDCPSAMHIDATFLPLRRGLAIYNPLHTDKERLQHVRELRDWELVPIGREPPTREWPPLYMTSPEIRMNVLSLDEQTVIVEEDDKEMANLLEGLEMKTVKMPFKHVQSLGGSFHCATLDLRRGARENRVV
jgi:glycine amidinotransferase